MFSIFIFTILLASKIVSGYDVVLSGDDDIVQGESSQFKVEVFKNDGTLSTSEFTFVWSDNADPQHTADFKAKSPAIWNVTYDSSRSLPEVYTVKVKVLKSIFLLSTTVGSASKTFKTSPFLKGDLILLQGNVTRKKYVSSEVPVNHHIVLHKVYLDFLNKTKNFIRTFWFIDCIYYGHVNGLQFDFNYTKPETQHLVEALLVASYIPQLPEKIVLNSTDKIAEGSSKLKSNVTFSLSPTSSNMLNSNSTESFADLEPALKEWLQNFSQMQKVNFSKSDYCINSSIVPLISNYSYGFFRNNLTVKSPVKVSPINGTNWLMDGEVLNINVSCNGSSPYSFCVLLKSGLYNITGHENCKNETMLKICNFGIKHLFKKPSEYTLVVIISNTVSKVIKPIAVNIYKVKKHAQLSVIIVPVSFSLIATILIIFGVAYYVQSKRKYTIEVADFDFGNQTSNMEYKSFRERLRESISNAFLKSHDYQDTSSNWSDGAPTSRKYGSMQ